MLLAFDVTEQAYAERIRREFTANVSHELKTPLQGIIGSAELLENGMVKPEDMPRFVGHIHDEAARLVTLVDDIIRLSQLDEGGAHAHGDGGPAGPEQEAVTNLQDAAAKQQVSLSVDGGTPRSSACGGCCMRSSSTSATTPSSITSPTAHRRGAGVLGERDLLRHGVGIPASASPRSTRAGCSSGSTGWIRATPRPSGGTGLGLSIVKHAVAYHHGDIRLTSKPGEGTVIRITFPAAAR